MQVAQADDLKHVLLAIFKLRHINNSLQLTVSKLASQSSDEVSNVVISETRGRGRGRSRGGIGKYLRARGRGRGYGRPAEFTKRLLLEDEEVDETDPDSEEAKALERKFAKRHVASNADRYVEPEPVLNSDGEVEEEPEVDLSEFLARQRLDDKQAQSVQNKPSDYESDIDHDIARIFTGQAKPEPRKGKLQQIEWDKQMEEISRLKAASEANAELKARLRAKVEKQRTKSSFDEASRSRMVLRKGTAVKTEAPALPTVTKSRTMSAKQEMVDFLDDLLD